MLRRLLDLIRRPRTVSHPTTAPATPAAPRDYAQEREERRLAQMSDEDKAWNAASQQRERENRAQNPSPPVA